MNKRKRPGNAVSSSSKDQTHSYECVIHGVVDGSEVSSFLQRLDGLTNDKTRKTELYSVVEMHFADEATNQEVVVRRTTETYKKSNADGDKYYSVPTVLEGVPNTPYWTLLIYGNYFRGSDYTTPVRSILESKVTHTIEGFITTLGLTKNLETGKIGQKIVTEDLIEIELFRVVTPTSLLNFERSNKSLNEKLLRKEDKGKGESSKREGGGSPRPAGKPNLDSFLPTVNNPMGGEDGEKLNPDELVYLLPPTAQCVSESPLLLSVRAIAATDKLLERTSTIVRTFVSKLGTNFQEISPDKFIENKNQ